MGNESQNIFLCSIGIKVLFKKYQLTAIMERKYVHKFIILSIWQGFHVKPVLIWLTRKSVNCIIAIGIQFSMMHGTILYLANMICGDIFALKPVWCEKVTTNHIDHASNRPYCKKDHHASLPNTKFEFNILWKLAPTISNLSNGADTS